MTYSITFNKTQNQELWIPCARCGLETWHKVLTSIETEQGDEYYGEWNTYQIIHCNGCRTISFRRLLRSTEDLEPHPTGPDDVLSELQFLYPSRIAGRRELPSLNLLPFEVAAIYGETHTALVNNSSILASIGIRALIEAVCQGFAPPRAKAM